MRAEIQLALICVACLGLSDFLYRYGQRFGLDAGPFMLLQNLAYISTALVAGTSLATLSFTPVLWLGLLNGALAFAGFLFILLALRDGEVTSLVPVIRLNFAPTGLLTVIFLAEALTLTRGVGLCLAAIAIVLMGPGLREAAGEKRSLGYALGAMLSFGFIGLFYKIALKSGATPASMVVAQSLGVLMMAIPFALYRKEPIPRSGPRLIIPLVCGVLTALSYLALATAFTYGDAVVVAPVAQLSFVLTSLLAIALLGERPGMRKFAGLLCAIAAVCVFGFL